MSTTFENITLQNIKDLMESSYELYYVDYRDSFEYCLDKCQTAIHKNCYSPLDDLLFDWDLSYTFEYILEELTKELIREYDLTEEEAELLIEQYRDEIRDEIYERDSSDPLKDLSRNTGDIVMFYDTGVYIGGHEEEDIQIIKEALHIKDDSYDQELRELVANSYSGGNLEIYFTSRLDDWLGLREDLDTITFDNPHIALVDHGNGSGFNVELGHSFSLPYNQENVFIDKEVSYSYTYDVCGMYSDWCSGTNLELTITKQEKAERSGINDHLDQEKQLDETFKNGGCTFGDMKWDRHRNKEYRNDFPCGWTCKDCGTFWID
jgi:hypothetical protein